MPDDKYSFRPQDGMRTFGQQDADPGAGKQCHGFQRNGSTSNFLKAKRLEQSPSAQTKILCFTM
jgi:hypothetical protein